MYFKLGTIHTHPAGEVLVTHTREILRDSADRAYATVEKWKLRGEIISTSSTALATAISVLEGKYNPIVVAAQPYAGLFYDSGTASHLYWNATASITGIKVSDGINFPQGGGVQHLTSRMFDVGLEATFDIAGSSKLVDYSERIDWKGNGKHRIAALETRNTDPVFQTVSQRTPVMLTQTGHATGRFDYPYNAVPPPFFPDYLQNPDDAIGFDQPKRNQRGFFTDHTIRWTYNFILPRRFLNIRPHFYPG